MCCCVNCVAVVIVCPNLATSSTIRTCFVKQDDFAHILILLGGNLFFCKRIALCFMLLHKPFYLEPSQQIVHRLCTVAVVAFLRRSNHRWCVESKVEQS